MVDDSVLASIDRQIAALQRRAESCRKAMVLSRIAIYAAAAILALVFTVAGSYRTPLVVFSAVTAIIGGTVWLGANRSTLDDCVADLDRLDASRERIIDAIVAENGWADRTPDIL